MTRDEAINKYAANQNERGSMKLDFTLIGEIFDYFESRTCENCIYYHTLGCKEHSPTWYCADFEKMITEIKEETWQQ